MIVGGYTDAHISVTSSILSNSGEYLSPRLDSIVSSFKWMYEEFDKKNVDIIVNLGDLVSSGTVLRVEEIMALKRGLSYSKGIPEKHILGNHERLDKGSVLHSIGLIDLLPNVEIIGEPTKIDDTVSLIPYQDSIDYEEIKNLSSDLMLSHLNLVDNNLANLYKITPVNKELIEENYNLVINGHIHSSSWISDKILNLGVLTGSNFNDNYFEYLPSIFVYDTEKDELEIIENPEAILFYKFNAGNLSELKGMLDDKIKDKKYAVRIKVDYSMKDDARELLDSYNNIIASRVITKITSNTKLSRSKQVSNITKHESGRDALNEYFKGHESPRYPYQEIKKVVINQLPE